MSETHKNSRKVKILRTSSFLNKAQNNAIEFVSMSKKSIGSYFESVNARMVGTGLTIKEQEYLLPDVIGVPVEDRGFRQEVNKFYQEIYTKVPWGERGLELEIGMEVDNELPLFRLSKEAGKEGDIISIQKPINVMDYIRYRHALKHPQVALSKEEAKGNQLKDYYIFDPEVVKKSTVELTQSKDEATLAYLNVKDDEAKVEMYLLLLKENPDLIAAELRPGKLRELADKKPVEFLKVYKDENFEELYYVKALVKAGVVVEVDGALYEKESMKKLGNNEREAVIFMKDVEKNSNMITILKGRLQEATGKTLKKPGKKNNPKPVSNDNKGNASQPQSESADGSGQQAPEAEA